MLIDLDSLHPLELQVATGAPLPIHSPHSTMVYITRLIACCYEHTPWLSASSSTSCGLRGCVPQNSPGTISCMYSPRSKWYCVCCVIVIVGGCRGGGEATGRRRAGLIKAVCKQGMRVHDSVATGGGGRRAANARAWWCLPIAVSLQHNCASHKQLGH